MNIRKNIPRTSRIAQRALLPGLMLASAATGIAGCVYVVLWGPADERVRVAEQAYGQAKQQQAQNRMARVVQERARDAAQGVADVWQGLPTEAEFSALAVAITELGRAEQVGIPGMAYRVEKREGGRPVKATLSFKASGEYGALYRFLQRLETAQSYLVIESLDAARADKSAHATSHVVVCNLTVATYLRSVPPAEKQS